MASAPLTEQSRRRVLQTGLTLVGGGLSGCLTAGSPRSPGSSTDDTVDVIVGPVVDGEPSYTFSPGTDENLNIEAGTRVRFVWESDTHNIVVESQPSDADWEGYTEIEDSGFEYIHEFGTEGTYRFVCEPHVALGMNGTIVVQ